MEYRINQRTKDKISILGIGSGSNGFSDHTSQKEGIELLRAAFENGINFYDLCCGSFGCFEVYGQAFADVRKQVLYQLHFGTDYTTGKYGWTTDFDTIRHSVDRQLEALKTDYIDYGFIHCLDEAADLEKYMANGVLDYLKDLKKQGVVKHIGLSSHTPALANRVLDMELIDMLMFSINVGYDFKMGAYAYGEADERISLYQRCVREGVGISVMKPFAAGQLLDAKASPFGQALTNYQCIQYVLDRPGVLTLVPGIRNMEELKSYLGFLEAGSEEKDYSVLAGFSQVKTEGRCVYCEHCQPCLAGLEIGLINKYYDLAKAGDQIAADHYMHLEKRADDCTGCGHCNDRCPFQVDQAGRMQEIEDYFRGNAAVR